MQGWVDAFRARWRWLLTIGGTYRKEVAPVGRLQRLLHTTYGAPWGRDPEVLGAALFRAQTEHYADLIEEAAELWQSPS